MPEAFIVDAVRTPIGRRGGGLAAVHPADLGAHVIAALLARTQADPLAVDDVVFGCVDTVGPQVGDIARTAWLAAGLPRRCPASPWTGSAARRAGLDSCPREADVIWARRTKRGGAALGAGPAEDPSAAVSRAKMLSEHGDVEGARSAYQQAIDSGHPEHAPAAAFSLGLLLGQHGDWAGAQAAYWYAANSGHPEHSPPAARNLGHIFKRQGRFRQAREAYELAIHSGHADVAPWSMVYLGNLLVHYRNPEGARACYQAAAESGHPEAAQRAARLLDAMKM